MREREWRECRKILKSNKDQLTQTQSRDTESNANGEANERVHAPDQPRQAEQGYGARSIPRHVRALKATTMWSDPEVASKNFEDAGKPKMHCDCTTTLFRLSWVLKSHLFVHGSGMRRYRLFFWETVEKACNNSNKVSKASTWRSQRSSGSNFGTSTKKQSNNTGFSPNNLSMCGAVHARCMQ